jgi:hypothetical protein
VAATIRGRYDQEARRLEALLPHGPRVAVPGSTEFWHADSERTCTEVGRLLASIPVLVPLTGGVEGIGEAVGLRGGTMPSGDRIVLKRLTAGHSGMPETWFLEADPATGAPLIGHTYWRVEEGGLYEGEDTERWPLEEAQRRVPDDVWRRAAGVGPRGTRPAGPGAAADRPHD